MESPEQEERPVRVNNNRDASWWEKVDQTVGCWIWTASKTKKGYGQFWNGERLVMAHRYGFEMTRGPIAYGFYLDHVCRVPACVKPTHFDQVSQSENLLRAPKATHCRRGHIFTPENTYTYPKSGARLCTICNPKNQPTAYREPRHTSWHPKAAALYADGMTQDEIAKMVNREASVVCRALKRMGTPIRPQTVEIDKEDFIQLVEAGVSRPGLAALFECSDQVISKRAREWMPDHVFQVGRRSKAQAQAEDALISSFRTLNDL